MRLKWFKVLGDDAYKKACIVFENAFNAYEEDTPRPEPKRAPTPPPASNDFLSSLIGHVDIDSDGEEPQLAEPERWRQGRGGGGEPNYPLKWWKVCISFIARWGSISHPLF